jgi:hypothetical protein
MAHATAVHAKMNTMAAIRLNMVVCAPILSAATPNLPGPVVIVKYFALKSTSARLTLLGNQGAAAFLGMHCKRVACMGATCRTPTGLLQ